MKALSLTQPWATLIAVGAKRIETRSWSTSYRGQVAIHAAKGFPRYARELTLKEPFVSALLPEFESWRCLPFGAIVAVATLTACVRTEDVLTVVAANIRMLPHELEFGDYAPGRYGWVLAGVSRLCEPVPCKGALGLWDIDAALERQIFNALKETV
jgi:hypothetical protein